MFSNENCLTRTPLNMVTQRNNVSLISLTTFALTFSIICISISREKETNKNSLNNGEQTLYSMHLLQIVEF